MKTKLKRFFSLAITLCTMLAMIPVTSLTVAADPAPPIPTVMTVVVPADKNYITGETLDFTLNFSVQVDVTGTPRVAIDIGGTPAYASYLSGSGSHALVFKYIVQVADSDTDGITLGNINLSSGAISNGWDNVSDGDSLAGVPITSGIKINAAASTAPSVPTAVSAVKGDTQAAISFTAPASDGGSAITGYTVTSSPGGLTGTGSVSPIIVTGLTNGTSYTFTVTATNSKGTSSASLASNSVTPAIVPDAPTGVSAFAGNAQVSISFTAPVSNGGSAITSYTVTSSPGGFTGTGLTSPITVTGLTNGTAYTFTVTATNVAGTSPASAASNSVTPSATAVPSAPTAVTAVKGNTQVAISFTAPTSNGGSAITGYTVTSSPGGFTGTGLGSPIIVTGLTNGTSYTFTVTATNGIGTSSASAQSNSVTPSATTAPSAPTTVSAVKGNTQATISFTAPASNGGSAITGYTVTSSPGGFTGTGLGSPITVTGLTNGTSYTFTVTATNGAGTSPASAASNSVVPFTSTVSSVPTAVSATAGDAQTTTTAAVTTTVVTAKEPKISGLTGWTKIDEEVLLANSGNRLNVDMNGTTGVPQSILSDLKGKDITVNLDFGTYSWEINGKDITAAQSVDLGITYTPNVISHDLVGGIAGNSSYIQLQLNYNGSFGFTGKLTVQLPAEMAGQYANLYYYNPTTNNLELYASTLIQKDGTATFNFSHASDYVVVMEKTAKSQNLSAGESVRDSAKPISKSSLLYAIATIVLAVGMIVYSKKKLHR